MITVTLLGAVRIDGPMGVVERLRTRTAMALFAYLVLNRRAHPRDELVERFWPEDEYESARQKLRLALFSIRKEIGDVLTADRLAVHIAEDADLACDYDTLRRALKRAKTLEKDERADLLDRSLKGHEGPLMPGYYDDWVVAERDRFEAELADALGHLARHHADAGRWSDALAVAQRLTVLEPYGEIGHALYLRSLAAIGRREAMGDHLRWLKELYQGVGSEVPRALRDLKPKTNPYEEDVAEPLFLGREQQLAELQNALQYKEPVILWGPAGIGKTRLAQALARDAERAWFIPLAPLRTREEFAAAVRAALAPGREAGAHPAQDLHDAAEDAPPGVLILDNLEHLMDEGVVEWIEAIRRINPALRIVVTTQRRPGLADERVLKIEPLEIPSPHAAPPQVAASASVRLLLALARPSIRVTKENAAAFADLAQRLGGNPLAISLASEWLRVLSPVEIGARLDEGLRLLASRDGGREPRHQNLEAAIAASFAHLAPDRRRILRDLAVFRGGWNLAAATAVTQTPDVADALADLVDRSLVVASLDDAGATRYDLLESVRAYALATSPEEDHQAALDRHAHHFARIAQDLDGRYDDYPRLIAPDGDNLRASVERLSERAEPETFARVVNGMNHYWGRVGHWNETVRWSEFALGRLPEGPTTVRANVENWLGCVQYQRGERAEALRWFKARRATFAALNDERGIARAEGNMAMVVGTLDPHAAIKIMERVVPALNRLGAPNERIAALNNLGEQYANVDRREEGLGLMREALAQSVHHEFNTMIGHTCLNIGWYLWLFGQNDEGIAHLLRAREALSDAQEQARILDATCFLAGAYATSRKVDLARAELTQALRLLPEVGSRIAYGQVSEAAAWVAHALGRPFLTNTLLAMRAHWMGAAALGVTPLHMDRLNAVFKESRAALTHDQAMAWTVRAATVTRRDTLATATEAAEA